MITAPAYVQCLSLASICLLFSCTNREQRIAADALRKETYHYFSNRQSKDYFVLRFLCSHCEAGRNEYTNFDILSGNLELSIYSSDKTNIFRHEWSVSNCFSMADNHYMSEAQKIEKFLHTVDHFFDSSKFSRMDELVITGILSSADSLLRREIEADTNSIGFSFIQEDFCLMYSGKSTKAVLLRALRKDLLHNYGLH